MEIEKPAQQLLDKLSELTEKAELQKDALVGKVVLITGAGGGIGY
jgi:FlaA1/EpsC-like NDP-sugar epimerase